MLTTIQGRMVLIFSAFATLLAAVVGASTVVIHRQTDDGLVVNLAGRQRMLTQKMSKEAMFLANAASSGDMTRMDAQRDELRQTMRVFESTLGALREGGPAPLNMELGQVRELPAAGSEQIRKQLDLVDSKWSKFKEHLEGVVTSRGTSAGDIGAIRQTNLDLLSTMNAAVGMMQKASESRVDALLVMQGAALLLGLILVGVGTWLARTTISAPIAELAEAARVMSTGNLSVEFRAQGAREVRDLGESFDRMRASMIASLNGGMMESSAVGDDF